MVYFSIVYFTYAISKRSNIFKYYFFASFIRVCCCSWVFDCYSCYNKYVSITIITKTWPFNWSSKLNLTISIRPSSRVISPFNPTFDSKFRWLIWYIAIKFFFDILLLYYQSIVLTVRLSIILCLSSGNIYFSIGIVLSSSSVTVSELLYFEFFETFAILLLMKLPVASGVFHILLLYNLNLFRYFFIILNCNFFWMTLFWIFWKFPNSISNFITNKITSCFCCFLNSLFGEV